MRIAYVTTIFPFGNAETFFRPEVRSLARDADVLIVSTRPRTSQVVFSDLGADAIAFGTKRTAVYGAALRELVRHPVGVARVLATVLFSPYRISAKAKNLILFPNGLALAHIARRRGIDHIHAQWITTPSTVAYIASRLTGIPWSITAHQHDIFAGNMLTAKVRSATFTRVISARNCRHLQELVAPDAARRCVVVHLGVEVPPAVIEPPPRARIRLLCAARLFRSKGHRYLIDAIARLRDRGIDLECDFAGVGELRKAIEDDIAARGLGDRIALLGNVHHERLTAALAGGEYDVGVLPSTEVPGEHEGIAISMMEAMAAGLPVVTTRTGSMDELVTAETGILVEQRDPAALADAIGRLAADPALRRSMGRRARERVRAHFSTETTTRALASLIVGTQVPTMRENRSVIGVPACGKG